MQRTDVLVIGGGQAGLAASYCLAAHGIEHVVLERGRVGERWRSSSWDSLRLQSPRWQSRLPGWSYRGADPAGYMSVTELVRYLEDYAASFAAPVIEGVAVMRVEPSASGYRVATSGGEWCTRAVIIATGYCDVPARPACATVLGPDIVELAATMYRRPDSLPEGGVLVIGASATGVLIADELRRAGRDVTLAVGNHTRVPRTHRGRDIYEWFERLGTLDEPVPDTRAPHLRSLQLAGAEPQHAVDLAALQLRGVRLTGRLVGIGGDRVRFANDLAATTTAADARAATLLGRIDRFAAEHDIVSLGPAAQLAPLVHTAAPDALDLRAHGITSVVWATGFRRDYSWLAVPGVVRAGELVHTGGVTPAPGLYALGLRFMRRRSSAFLDGVGRDALAIVDHLATALGERSAA